MSARALYLHIPFCKRKCAYCDFTSFATPAHDPLMAAYCDALARQLDELASRGLLERVETAYIGGGTPTFAGNALAALAAHVSASCETLEFSVEANPDSLTLELGSKLAEAGVTRLSVGVQSLDDGELAALGRVHGASDALRALGTAASCGLIVSADLMCAIPRQTPESWQRTLEGVLCAGVSHVSVYPLMIEEGTAFARAVEAGELDYPDDACEARLMEQAEAQLSARGFLRYEVASYALPGHECRHNRAYWTGLSYMGLGTGASGMFDGDALAELLCAIPQLGPLSDDTWRVRLTCTSDMRHLAALPALADARFDVEQLTYREALAEDLMLGARLSCGISNDLVRRARHVMGDALDSCLLGLVDEGFLTHDLKPTHKGWLLGNVLYGRLWELAGRA